MNNERKLLYQNRSEDIEQSLDDFSEDDYSHIRTVCEDIGGEWLHFISLLNGEKPGLETWVGLNENIDEFPEERKDSWPIRIYGEEERIGEDRLMDALTTLGVSFDVFVWSDKNGSIPQRIYTLRMARDGYILDSIGKQRLGELESKNAFELTGRFIGVPEPDYAWAKDAEGYGRPKSVDEVEETILQREISERERAALSVVSYIPKPTCDGYERAIDVGESYLSSCERAVDLGIIEPETLDKWFEYLVDADITHT